MNEALNPKKPEITKFIIVTQDYSGLGWADMLLDENDALGGPRKAVDIECIMAVMPKEEEDDFDSFDKVGEGMVEKIPLEDLFKQRKKYRDWAWIWDGNHHAEFADKLRSEGFYVLGGHVLADRMEHDRDFGLSLIKKAGLTTPEYEEFQSIEDGIRFLEENEDRAFVFKPDEPDNKAWVTTCPDSDNDEQANNEMLKFLASQNDGLGSYVLQERKKGVEINVEMWLYEGKPFFAHANFECKRKYNGDWGKMIGCAQDIEFLIPLHCKVLDETLWKLAALSEFKDYTGFLDMNLIVADNKYYFLEFCARFGYNSHPNLFLTLGISPISAILSDMLTGNVENFYEHFRAGFGASITMWIDDPVTGLPIIFDNEQETESRFFHFDTYKDGDDYYLAGYANEVGIICAHDYDLKSAAEEALRKFNRIHYSGHAGRTDLARTDYQTNPSERYLAAVSMKLFDKNADMVQ